LALLLNKSVGQAAWAGRKQRFLEKGHDLAWLELGDRDAPPLLLIHGFTDSSRSWSLVAPHLSRFRLILPDLRGHGASGAPEHGYGPTVMAADLLGLVDHLGLASAHLAGHSMGDPVRNFVPAAGLPRSRPGVMRWSICARAMPICSARRRTFC
jgi:hypothetical protein